MNIFNLEDSFFENKFIFIGLFFKGQTDEYRLGGEIIADEYSGRATYPSAIGFMLFFVFVQFSFSINKFWRVKKCIM